MNLYSNFTSASISNSYRKKWNNVSTSQQEKYFRGPNSLSHPRISQKTDQTPLHYPSQPPTQISLDKLDDLLTFNIPILDPSRHSTKTTGKIKSFAANTHQGLIRNYNEDRVSIILNMMKPEEKVLKNGEQWPGCSFFGIYDGHGGKKCAEFLRDNLHQFIIT